MAITINDIEKIRDKLDEATTRRKTQAFMTQRSATKIAELREAGRGMPWLDGVEVRIVTVGATIIGKSGHGVRLKEEGQIIFAPETSRAIGP